MSDADRLRRMLDGDELFRYATIIQRQPLRLSPVQNMRLNRLLDQFENEKPFSRRKRKVNAA